MRMQFTKEGVPTHASFTEMWQYRKVAQITKKVTVRNVFNGQMREETLYQGDVVWALLYLEYPKAIYLVQSPRLQRNLTVPADCVQIIKEVHK